MLKHLFIAAAFLVSFNATAPADVVTSTVCGKYVGSYRCVTRSGVVENVPVEQRTQEEIEQFNRDWEAFCQPQRTAPDQYGVIRMIYAHPGCEFGRTF